MKVEELAEIVDELIDVLRMQAAELEKLIVHLEQVTVPVPEEREQSLIRSTLNGLHLRIRKLRQAEAASS
ncbi:MAG: hypothetical protein K6T86_19430 [Pirellulales bacterium]|nr:hypothetical protein [Pirellulales bacterium]